MNTKCIYNRKALAKAKYGICYFCSEVSTKEQLEKGKAESLKCPNCKKLTVLPVQSNDDFTQYWIALNVKELLYG
jgi:ribosomal protein L37AE/L43A